MAQRQVQIINECLQMPSSWRLRQQSRRVLTPPPGLSRPLNLPMDRNITLFRFLPITLQMADSTSTLIEQQEIILAAFKSRFPAFSGMSIDQQKVVLLAACKDPEEARVAGTNSVPARDAPGLVLEGPLRPFDNDNYLLTQVDETVCSPAEEAIEMGVMPTPGTPPSSPTPPESFKWSRRRARRVGHLQAHVRFLQHMFRGYRRLRPGGWGMRGGLHGCPSPVRPVTHFRCRGGMCLAHESEYREMATRSASVADW